MKLKWQQMTRNNFVAYLPGGTSIAIRRSPRWKSMPGVKPWRAEVLGNIWADGGEVDAGHDDADDAMAAAERILKATVRKLAKAVL